MALLSRIGAFFDRTARVPLLQPADMGMLRRLLSRTPRLSLDVEVDKTLCGTTYGGYAVVPRLLSPGGIAYSFGVGEDASFDLALIEMTGVQLHAFDPTPRSLAWVEQQTWPDSFSFHPVGVAGANGTLSLHPPPDPTHVSFTTVARKGGGAPVEVPVKTVATLMKELGHTQIDLLKADVEGAEYEVIDNLLAEGIRPAQLMLEFHHHLPGIPLSRTRKAIADLRAAGYGLFDQSERGAEMSFVRRDCL